MDTFDKKIAVIGGGHIGQALVEGFINSGKIYGNQIIISNPSLSKLTHLEKYGVELTSDNKTAAEKADYVFLSVKPLIVGVVLREISSLLEEKIVISLAAVVSIYNLKKYAKRTNIIRVMPNMAISCNQGVIGYYARGHDKFQVKKLLSTLGTVIKMKKEVDLDLLTLLSGCGPAIVSQFIELLENYGIKIGLSADVSQTTATLTFKGTTAILEQKKQLPSQLIQSVCTKGGISEAILDSLKMNGFQSTFDYSMDSGLSKIRALKDMYNKKQEEYGSD